MVRYDTSIVTLCINISIVVYRAELWQSCAPCYVLYLEQLVHAELTPKWFCNLEASKKKVARAAEDTKKYM